MLSCRGRFEFDNASPTADIFVFTRGSVAHLPRDTESLSLESGTEHGFWEMDFDAGMSNLADIARVTIGLMCESWRVCTQWRKPID